MYYLLCMLLFMGGGPKYQIDGHVYFSEEPSASCKPLHLEICQDNKCTPVKMTAPYEFELKLKKGDYELRYTNQWRQRVSEALSVDSDKTLALDGSTFHTRDTYPVWASFEETGTLSIAERTEEKGHIWERLIDIRRLKGGIEVELYDPASDIIELKMLSPLETDQLEDFLRKVDLYNGSKGCDVSVLYLMQAGEETFIIEDGSCDLRQLDTILYDLYVSQYVSQEFP
ncbi:MAG: hypothetical protein AAGA85_07285 [Bacteroidota bacterium]